MATKCVIENLVIRAGRFVLRKFIPGTLCLGPLCPWDFLSRDVLSLHHFLDPTSDNERRFSSSKSTGIFVSFLSTEDLMISTVQED